MNSVPKPTGFGTQSQPVADHEESALWRGRNAEPFGTSITATKEAELVEAAIRGDGNAFEQLFSAHVSQIRKTGWPILKTQADLDDLVQDVFLLASQGIKSFRGDSTFRTWITTISKNRCFALLRARPKAYMEDLPASYEPIAKERSAELAEARIVLSHLMSGLPAQTCEVVELTLQGLSSQEIAIATAQSSRAVRSRLGRAKASMRQKYLQSPEQIAAPGSLMFDKTLLRPEGTEMAASRKRKPRTEKAAVGSPEKSLGVDIPAEGQEAKKASDSFSFDDLVAEVARLDYLALLEARREFDAEIVLEAEHRLRGFIRGLLKESDLHHEQEIFRRLVNAIVLEPNVKEDLARLQKLPMGPHSRHVRLWYVETVGQHLLSRTVDEVLQAAENAAATSGGIA